MVGLMANSKRVFSKGDLQCPCPCGEPLPTHTSTGGPPTLAGGFASVSLGSLLFSEFSVTCMLGFPGSSVVKTPPADAGEPWARSLGSRRSSGEGSGNPLQYAPWRISWTEAAWQTTAHGVARVGYALATKQQHSCLATCLQNSRKANR